MEKVQLKWKVLNTWAEIPKYMSQGASGFDFRACLMDHPNTQLLIQPGETVCVPTGLAVEIPEGAEIQIRPRSGISMKTKLRLPNTPGTIDSDYRGEVGILMENTSVLEVAVIKHGERIAQGVVAPVIRVEHILSDVLSTTTRGENGFGKSPEEGY